MKRALVVVEDTVMHRTLLKEAGELAAGVDAELVLLSTMTEAEFETDRETMDTIASVENTNYGDEAVLETARRFAKEIATEEFEEPDLEYTAVGAVVEDGERANEIVEIADKKDCDHVFIPGRRRSPAGKAIFGDTAQSVILNFDGRVTISTA